jgi:hypothetical protein
LKVEGVRREIRSGGHCFADERFPPREGAMSSTTAEAPIPSQTVIARPRDERRVSLLTLCLLALGVGILTGIGAVALRALIA